MAVKSGFFNAENHDRLYNADNFNSLIDTIKEDGIDNYGAKLEVSEGDGLTVQVGVGRCYFDSHWLVNDGILVVGLDPASPVAPRIDAIVVEISETDRNGVIKSVTGTPNETPTPPELIDTSTVHQHALAYVEVDTRATEVGEITDARTEWSDLKYEILDEVVQGSNKPVTSDAIYEALQASSTVDSALSFTSENAIQNQAVTKGIAGLIAKTTNTSGTNIVETRSDCVITTSFPDANTIVETVVPTTGAYKYVKTTTFSGSTITETVQQQAK